MTRNLAIAAPFVSSNGRPDSTPEFALQAPCLLILLSWDRPPRDGACGRALDPERSTLGGPGTLGLVAIGDRLRDRRLRDQPNRVGHQVTPEFQDHSKRALVRRGRDRCCMLTPDGMICALALEGGGGECSTVSRPSPCFRRRTSSAP